MLIAVVPIGSSWVFPALLLNRVLSGAAEAFASGADEALAFDSLKAAGKDGDWPRVLERLMQVGGLATIFAMVTGSLVYSPDLFQAAITWAGYNAAITLDDTFRLPVCNLLVGMWGNPRHPINARIANSESEPTRYAA